MFRPRDQGCVKDSLDKVIIFRFTIWPVAKIGVVGTLIKRLRYLASLAFNHERYAETMSDMELGTCLSGVGPAHRGKPGKLHSA